jgi:hypothetical protein
MLNSRLGPIALAETEAGVRLSAEILGRPLGVWRDDLPLLLRRLEEPRFKDLARGLELSFTRMEVELGARFSGARAGTPEALAFFRVRAGVELGQVVGTYSGSRAAFFGGGEQLEIWRLREGADPVRGARLEKELEVRLRTLKVVEKTALGGGLTPSYLVKLEDGTLGVFKPTAVHWASNSGHEVGAYVVDRALGIYRVPVTVSRTVEGEAGSIQFYVRDSLTGTQAGYADGDRPMRLLDYLLDNPDRHGANFLVVTGQGNRHVAIDHGLAFGLGTDAPYILGPIRPDRAVYDRLKALTRADAFSLLGGHVEAPRIDALLKRRDALVDAIQARGEATFFN